jgi:metal-responsive CopG/Arc/MetJ family transcriptional regulator
VGRILVDIPQKYLDELGAIARVEKLPRAEIIRRAIANYVEQNRPATADAFGIWKDRQVDGLDYQEAIRSEW